jgi:hypothetical protein
MRAIRAWLCRHGYHRGDTWYDFSRRMVHTDCRDCKAPVQRRWP